MRLMKITFTKNTQTYEYPLGTWSFGLLQKPYGIPSDPCLFRSEAKIVLRRECKYAS